MLLDLLFFLVGLALLSVGAERFIEGAVGIAKRYEVSPLIIGMVIVGFGTSAPELAVNLSAALKDTTDVALGNIVGSNISNIALILGLSALLNPLKVDPRLLKFELPVLVALSFLLWGLAYFGDGLNRMDGLLLLMAFVGWNIMVFTQDPPGEDAIPEVPTALLWTLLYIGGGFVGLVVGAQLMVDAAVSVARAFGVSELVIGLTIVAIGTSLPELAASVAAALKNQAEMAVGNIIGSNAFNILLVLGMTSVVTNIPVPEQALTFDFPVMLILTVMLVPIMSIGQRIDRLRGGILLTCYGAYIGYLVYTSFQGVPS